MADKRKPSAIDDMEAPESADASTLRELPVERIPSTIGSISALASANAPHIFFSDVPFLGYICGNGDITLTTIRHIANVEGHGVAADMVVTAVLHGSLESLRSLKSAIEKIEGLAAAQAAVAEAAGSPPPSGMAH